MARRSVLGLLLLAVLALAFFKAGNGFVAPPRAASQPKVTVDSVAAGAAAGWMALEPVHASIYGTYEYEIKPVMFTSAFAIIWGIILGFVLLRLQEAFPE
mmetsp:Transcript_133240/g.188252  ORF Transcript_133240/g.188252 Transcript_133240/m.188252 type:complete len:100 (-) Transcript_133240:37-336(-)